MPQEIDTNMQEVQSDVGGVDTDFEMSRIIAEETGEHIDTPYTELDPIRTAKDKAEQLLRRLNAPND